ncbi:MAG: hypothetical protein OEX76_07420 [Candidatus Bathyarchaeota archaeon]|nr:hypothetical protein [Candidatus Bathyarchaeota archaeon]
MSIEKFFTTIKDGSWHSIDDLSDQLELPPNKLTELSKFLSDHDLLQYDDKIQRIRIRLIWKLLLTTNEEPNEPKTTVATLVIPPQNSIKVQSIQFNNISDVEVEVSLRISSEKISEVAIKI